MYLVWSCNHGDFLLTESVSLIDDETATESVSSSDDETAVILGSSLPILTLLVIAIVTGLSIAIAYFGKRMYIHQKIVAFGKVRTLCLYLSLSISLSLSLCVCGCVCVSIYLFAPCN